MQDKIFRHKLKTHRVDREEEGKERQFALKTIPPHVYFSIKGWKINVHRMWMTIDVIHLMFFDFQKLLIGSFSTLRSSCVCSVIIFSFPHKENYRHFFKPLSAKRMGKTRSVNMKKERSHEKSSLWFFEWKLILFIWNYIRLTNHKPSRTAQHNRTDPVKSCVCAQCERWDNRLKASLNCCK